MDICIHKLLVYRPDAHRERCCRKFCLRRDEPNPLRAFQLYRCYAAWQSKFVMILPVLLWCAAGGTYDGCFEVIKTIDYISELEATGIGGPYTASKVTLSEVYAVYRGSLSQWITSFWATALATNLLTTRK